MGEGGKIGSGRANQRQSSGVAYVALNKQRRPWPLPLHGLNRPALALSSYLGALLRVRSACLCLPRTAERAARPCVQVRYLKVVEKSNYQATKWIRYLTKSGQYEHRCEHCCAAQAVSCMSH